MKGIAIFLIILGLAFLLIVVFSFGETVKEYGDNGENKIIDLNVSVRSIDEVELEISNQDTFDWTNVQMEINPDTAGGGYVLRVDKLEAKEIYTVGIGQFTKKDGTRFNPFTTKLLELSIFCDTPKGKGRALQGPK